MPQLSAEDLEAMLDEQTDKIEIMKDLAEEALVAWDHGQDSEVQRLLNVIIST